MSVGQQTNSGNLNSQLSSLVVQLREACRDIANLNTQINGQAAGLATLEALGFSGTANPANPGGVSDAQYYLNMLAYLNTVAGVYFGTADQASQFNFDQELSQVVVGQ